MARRRSYYPAMANMDNRCTWPVTLKGDSHSISCFRLRKIGTLCRQHEAIRIRNLTSPANEAARSTTMPTFHIKLMNDNGAKTGCGSATIEVRATDRKRAQDIALKHQQEVGGSETAWRLHDSEASK